MQEVNGRTSTSKKKIANRYTRCVISKMCLHFGTYLWTRFFFLHRNGWYLMFYLFAQPIFPKFRAINYHKTTVYSCYITQQLYKQYRVLFIFLSGIKFVVFHLYIYIYAYHWFVVCFRRLKVEVTLYIMFYIQPHNLNQKFTHSMYVMLINMNGF